MELVTGTFDGENYEDFEEIDLPHVHRRSDGGGC